MKKVINITLGGFVFAIEDSAFEKLSAYLAAIEKAFSSNTDYKEISLDIENAIAEKFTQKGRGEKHAVTIEDVEIVVTEMGNVEEFATNEETSNKKETGTHEQTQGAPTTTQKRLYRDTEDQILAGVASGIARYFDIDPVIVRLLFVLSLFFNGFGILAYIILWLVVPAAETTEQKYAMRGDKVTIAEITERVKKNIDKIDEKKIEAATRGLWQKIRDVLQKIFSLLGKLLQHSLSFVRILLGFSLLIFGAFGVAGLVSAVSILWLGENALVRPEYRAIFTEIFLNPAGYLFVVSLFVTVCIPFLIFITLGGSMVSGKNLFTLTKAVLLGIMWVIATTLTLVLGILYQPLPLERIETLLPEQARPHVIHVYEEVPATIIYESSVQYR